MLKLAAIALIVIWSGCIGPPGEGAPDLIPEAPGDACFLDEDGAYHGRLAERLTASEAWQRIAADASGLALHWAHARTDADGAAETWTFGTVDDGFASTITVRAEWSKEPRHPSSDRRCPAGEIHVASAGPYVARDNPLPASALANAAGGVVAWLDGDGWRAAAEEAPSHRSMFDAVAVARETVPDSACLVSATGREQPGAWIERGSDVVGVRLPDGLGADGRANVWTLTFTDGVDVWAVDLEGAVTVTSQGPGQVVPCPTQAGIDSTTAAEAFGEGSGLDTAFFDWAGGYYGFTVFSSDTVMTFNVDDQTGHLR